MNIGKALEAWGESGDEALVLVDDSQHVLWCSRAFSELTGYEAKQMKQFGLDILTHSPYSRKEGSGQIELRKERISASELKALRFDGTSLELEVKSAPVLCGDVGAWVLTFRERVVTSLDESLRKSERRFRTLAERNPVATFFSGGGLRLEYVSDRLVQMLGKSAEELLGTGWLRNLPPSVSQGLAELFEKALQGEARNGIIEVGPKTALLVNVEPVHEPGGGAIFVGTVEDVSERVSLQKQLSYQAHHDTLTGLPNRLALWEMLKDMMPRANGDLALMFLDLDNFKVINDSLGHNAGDDLLVKIARRLENAVRKADTVIRFGGDEFLIVVRHISQLPEIMPLVERVLKAVTEPVFFDSVEFHPSASIGVALASSHHKDPQDLVRDADIAMYKAKRAGKNRWDVCDDETRRIEQDRLVLLADLRKGLEVGEVWVSYQPVVELKNRLIAGVEALARWNHPERGNIAPLEFIKLAEENGLIARLGGFVLESACAQMASWIEDLKERAPRKVNVNVSMLQLDESFPSFMAQALENHNLSPDRICLELTESALMDDRPSTRHCLDELDKMGVLMAIDDFGTGYSSLSYLRQLPIGYLKVDKSFVDEIGTEMESAGAVAQAVIAMADSLGMSVVAEGVETSVQADQLDSMGCEYGQGYHFSRPVKGEDITVMIREGR